MDQNGKQIEKRAFFQLVKSGVYLIEKKTATDQFNRYQLVKTNNAIKSISTTLKSIGNDALRNLDKEGTPFPQFNFKDIDGKQYSNESIKGKTVILKCWFIGCAACVKEFPELNALVEEYKDRDDFVFLSLADDDDSDLI